MRTKSIFIAAAIATAALAGAGCASHSTTMGATAAPAGAASQFTTSEREFVTMAAGNGMYEVEVSRVALTRASNPQVKAMAQMMVDHHTANNNELIAIMKAKNFPPPAGLPADKQAKIARMSGLTGAAFDREYVRVPGVEDHMANIALFERGQREAQDPALKAYIAKTLPVLRQHLQGAQALAGQMAG